ncbi:MAG TPA: hypothetical protein DDW27_03310, partial [Bacteroidales bacterium]|nr:hypothetical protein [Bacteroidales bacterium]
MVNSKIVQKALKKTLALENNPVSKTNRHAVGQSSIISRLMYDIFGGEILKTRMEKDWYFYNLIEGKRVDFTRSQIVRFSGSNDFADIPSTPDETYTYFEKEDYATFSMRFISAFEEAVGLKKYCMN